MRTSIIVAAALALWSAAPIASAQMTCPPQSPVPKNAALLCWTNATTDVAGNPLPAPPAEGSLKTTRIQHIVMPPGVAPNPAPLPCDFATATAANPIETINVTPDVGSYYWPANPTPLKVGRHCFRLRHINSKDVMSDWTAPVDKIVAAIVIAKPQPPSSVTVSAGAPNVTMTTDESNGEPVDE